MTTNKVEDFFIPDNEIKLSEELDYSRVDDYIRTVEAFARSSYQSVYIIDYFKQGFLYVSPNSTFLCGLTPEQMMEAGYRFYLDYVPEDEQLLLLESNRAGFKFFSSIPLEHRLEWYIQYDFHILNGRRPTLIHHKLTPLALTSDGRVWLALCLVSASAHTTPGHIEMHCVTSSDFYEYNMAIRRWKKCGMPELSAGEKMMITLSIQGFTMTEIADRMCLSHDTIKKYRKQIFEKLGVRNISEAIVAATNNKLI